MAENRIEDHRSRRYIRITDEDSWLMIDEIARTDYYSKSFNKIINDALFYGLPILYDKVIGAENIAEQEKRELTGGEEVTAGNLRFYALLVRLLREVILNVTINKSLLSTLCNEKECELRREKIAAEKFASGYYSDTPDYLVRYEAEGLKKLRK